jgi:hypothetical protein
MFLNVSHAEFHKLTHYFDTIHSLTAIGWIPSGSSTVHTNNTMIKKIHKILKT